MAIQFHFLFDECLCLELTDLAHSLGYAATSIRNLDRLGDPDSSIAAYAVARDLIVVTNNRADYVRLYARMDLHPGLVVILPNVKPDVQLALFATFAEAVETMPDLTNCLVEIDRHHAITVTEWPPARANDEL